MTLSRGAPGQRARALGEAPLGRLLLQLGLPGAVGMLIMSLYNLVDTFWVSRLADGPVAISALTVCFPIEMIRGAIAFGLHVGVASLVSRRLGEGRADEANRVCGHAAMLPAVVGLALIVIVSLRAEALLAFFGARPDIIPLARDYLTAAVFGSPFILFMIIVDGAYRGTGNLILPMFVMGTSAVVNLLLDPLFIFGGGPVPALGVRGAAIATVIAQGCSATGSLLYLLSGRSGFKLTWSDLLPRRDILAEIARVGAPQTAMQFVQSAVVSVFNHLLGAAGPSAIAAYGLTYRLLMMLMPLLGGVSFGLMPIIGYCFGAGAWRRMWRAAGLAAGVSAGVGTILTLVIWPAAPLIVGLFARDPELRHWAELCLRMATLALGLMAPQMVAVSTLQGMGYGSRAMLISLARQGLFLIPAVLLLSARYGLPGIFAAIPVADTIGFVVAVALVRGLRRRHPPVDRGRAEPRPEPDEVPLVEELVVAD